MSIPILEACKKRRIKPKIYGFHTFADPGCPLKPIGPFRENIRLFLQHCAQLEEYTVQGMPIWCILLVHENRNFMVPLYVIEENVKLSSRPYCDQCRCTGWSNHFVSKRKYHLIIPAYDGWNKPLDDGVFDLQNHVLHGLIHCNGFGHLLCINGIEGGSMFLCGREIMDLWDRICTNLRTRKITVEDLSKKRSMDLRLLHGVAYGHSWFGRWGYKFCRGSFGVREHHYTRAIEILGSLELDTIIQDLSDISRSREIKQIIRHYRDLSETQLVTMKDILKFMLTIKSHPPWQKNCIKISSVATSSIKKSSPKEALQSKNYMKDKSSKYRRFPAVVANMDSRWPSRRLEYAAEVIVNALKEKKAEKFSNGGMTRQDVRDSARSHIGDTGLLDYVLKSLNNVIVGNYIVRRSVNPKSRILEYTIHEAENENEANLSDENGEVSIEMVEESGQIPGIDVYSDVLYLYKNVLLDYPGSELIMLASQGILDSKHFAKVWSLDDDEGHLLTFICRVIPSMRDLEAKTASDLPPPPGEIIILPLHVTLVELKQAAESALRDTYCVAEEFTVTEIVGLEDMKDEEVIFGTIESGSNLCIRGSGIDLETPLKYQGGADTWKVKCECGSRDDDGERMIACDICEVWQHTRCCGIDDNEMVPPLFVCVGCCGSLGHAGMDTSLGFEPVYLESVSY